MKKSEIYKKAQLAVLRDERLSDIDKLEIFKELQSKEATELFFEEGQAGKNETN